MNAEQETYILGRLVQANDEANRIILALKNAPENEPVDRAAILRRARHIAAITYELNDRIRHRDMPAIERP